MQVSDNSKFMRLEGYTYNYLFARPQKHGPFAHPMMTPQLQILCTSDIVWDHNFLLSLNVKKKYYVAMHVSTLYIIL